MNKKDTEYFKKLLLDKRRELMEQMDFIKEAEMETTVKEASGDHSSYAFHMADQGTDTMEREKNFYYAQRDGRLLYHIDQTLERIEKGTFGLCQSCNNPIDRKRLMAVPHARLCIQCKSKEERVNES
ncbi:TraR/DksA family transcriptional regulator [bacterium]|nr:TraR/DksA family transcriptional regulator [bacterium]RQV98103.1 MAG: TraR/DksA family transcriptional regulator [bacterium]